MHVPPGLRSCEKQASHPRCSGMPTGAELGTEAAHVSPGAKRARPGTTRSLARPHTPLLEGPTGPGAHALDMHMNDHLQLHAVTGLLPRAPWAPQPCCLESLSWGQHNARYEQAAPRAVLAA